MMIIISVTHNFINQYTNSFKSGVGPRGRTRVPTQSTNPARGPGENTCGPRAKLEWACNWDSSGPRAKKKSLWSLTAVESGLM